jgi:hypothetical protein
MALIAYWERATIHAIFIVMLLLLCHVSFSVFIRIGRTRRVHFDGFCSVRAVCLKYYGAWNDINKSIFLVLFCFRACMFHQKLT